ncbi:GntR family transcriptional regulator [Companilactobacillus sp. FL22-1]|uniref:GntR family transcriptional regulator n=1 Tax=Companilactobacillus sp. FL22-1 TaxID=3373892 RepID=UPI003755155B
MVTQILYQKVADDIKRHILSGSYEVGTLIPTENELEKKYQVSKITVRKAVEQLVSEGYLNKKSGIGTRVISNNLFNKLSKAKSYSSIINETELLTRKILEFKNISIKDTPIEGKDDSQEVLFVKKMYLLNDEPFIIVKHYLPNIKLSDKDKRIEQMSLYTFLKDNGQIVDNFKDEFQAVNINAKDRKLLKKDDSLALKRIRRGFDNQGKLIEYTISIYDSNKKPYEIEYEI